MIADLPPSLRGLMVAAFAAAYMSTIATQLNWGASYLVNDFYRRFLKPKAIRSPLRQGFETCDSAAYVISAVVTFYLDSIAGAWKMLLVTGAGTGSVLLFRWYWWRINAWSEVSAMISAFACRSPCNRLPYGFRRSAQLRLDHDDNGCVTTVVWLSVTTLPRPSRAKSRLFIVDPAVRDRDGDRSRARSRSDPGRTAGRISWIGWRAGP